MSEEIAQKLMRQLDGDGQAEIIQVEVGRYIAVTVADLRDACDANPRHPSARVFVRSLGDYPDGHKMLVDRVDLEALIKNRHVTRVRLPGNRHQKQLGDEISGGKQIDRFPASLKQAEDEEPEIGSTSPADGDETGL